MKVGAVMAIAGWLCVTSLAFVPLLTYQSLPGRRSHAGPMWPPASKLARTDSGDTLVMFVHPQCPCTAASMDQLDKLAAKVGSGFRATVVVEQPAYMDAHWADSAHAQHAARIRGVSTVVDRGQTEARLFGATTSGDTFVYSADGTMMFHGGITPGRGHEGDCAGFDEVASLLRGRVKEPVRPTDTFGCALFNN